MKKAKVVALILTLLFTTAIISACGKSNSEGNNQTVIQNNDALAEKSKETDLLTEIKEKGTILIGTEGTYTPYTYHDETGELVGFDVEIAKAVAERLGVEAQFVETNWDSIIAGLDAERFDVVVNQVGITEERLEKYDFSTPYTVTRAALIVAKDNDTINTFEDLEGKIAAQGLTSNYGKMSTEYGAELMSTDGSFSKAIELVSTGRADATINDEVSFYDFLKQQPEAPVKIVATLDEASENAILIRKGNENLVVAINEALKELEEDGTLEEISKKYFGVNVTK